MSRFAAKHTTDIDPSLKGEEYEHGFSFSTDSYTHIIKPGLNEGVVREISAIKKEPEWMLKKRLEALQQFEAKPTPQWGGDLSAIDYDKIHYYLRPTDVALKNWSDVPKEIKTTFDRLGIPEAERNSLAGVKMQYDSEVVYGSLKKTWEKDGVIFLSMDEGLAQYPDLVKEYFGKLIPSGDNKFAALNGATWSGGCLTENARVFTVERGLQPISQIEEGDTVFAVTEGSEIEQSKVLAKIHSGKKETYEFLVAGRRMEATSTHMFLCAEKSEKKLNKQGKQWFVSWKPLKDLQKGSIIAIAKKLPDFGVSKMLPLPQKYIKNTQHETLSFPTKTNEDLMWFLGLWLGDGCTYFPSPHMCQTNIALPVTDGSRLEAVKTVKKIFGYIVTTQNDVSFTIYSKALGNWLKDIEFIGKAKTKRIPTWVFSLPVSERLALLGGILDSDGWIENNGKTIRFELANQKLIEDIKMLAISCGLFSDGKILERSRVATFFKKEKRDVYSGTAYSCRVTGNLNRVGLRNQKKREVIVHSGKKTFDKYSTVTGQTLNSLSTEYVGFAPIREKKCIGVQEVYDIQVEKHANFISNGIVAHNSFVYVPKGVEVKMPLQTYFRINAPNAGQFERTLIIVDEGAKVHYVEGCFVAGTKIQTEQGLVKIEDIQNGDAVLTHQGRYRTVYHTQVRPYTGQLFTVKTRGNPNKPIQATEEHPFLVVKRQRKNERNTQWKTEWLPVKEVQSGDYLCVPILGQKDGKYQFVEVGSISSKKIINHPVYNFSVEEDESYVAGGAAVHNCTAPSFSSSSLHSAVVEIYIKKGGRCQYTTVQNWYKNVYNLVTKRAWVEEEAEMIWTDFNMGCLAASARVFVEGKGAISIAEVKPGDTIWSTNLQTLKPVRAKVLASQQTGIKKTYRLTTENSRVIEATENHPFLVMTQPLVSQGFPVLEWRHLRDIQVGDRVGSIDGLPEHNSQIEFVRVMKKEEKELEPVYDLEIEGTANFIANGFVVHNSKLTMKYPAFILAGKGARGETLSMALAGAGQHQDTGSKATHLAPYTSSTIISKSISKNGGRTSYRGLIQVNPAAHHSKNTVICDALLLDSQSRSDTYPTDRIYNSQVEVQHEATVSKIGDEQLFYLMSRGLTEEMARKMIVNGFIDDIVKKLPLEYAVEMNRLIDHEMEGSIG